MDQTDIIGSISQCVVTDIRLRLVAYVFIRTTFWRHTCFIVHTHCQMNSWNSRSSLTTNYRALPTTLGGEVHTFTVYIGEYLSPSPHPRPKSLMMVDDSFSRLTTRMIIYDSFAVSSCQSRLITEEVVLLVSITAWALGTLRDFKTIFNTALTGLHNF